MNKQTNKIIEEKYGIDTSKLEVGQTFSNYKKACEYFNQEPLKADSKDAQLKEWSRYFDSYKEGQKIIVTEIYDEPLDKNDGRVTNGTQYYTALIADVLLAHMSQTQRQYKIEDAKNFDFIYTVENIAKILGIVNKNYGDKRIEKSIIEQELMKEFQILDFYKRSRAKFCAIIESALKNLRSRRIIICNKVLVICYTDKNTHTTAKKIATPDEEKAHLEVEHKVLKDMGYTNINQVIFSKNISKFYKTVNDICLEKFGWNYAYSAWGLGTTKNILESEIEYANEQRKELNKRFADFLENQSNDKYLKWEHDYKDGNVTFTLDYSLDSYQIKQDIFSDLFVRLPSNKKGVIGDNLKKLIIGDYNDIII